MNGLKFWLLMLAALVSGCTNESGLVGTYISSGHDDGAMMVQIESFQDSRVHGVLTIVEIGEGGRIQVTRRPLSGALEDKALNLSIEGSNGSAMMTGLVVDDGLDLTFIGNGTSLQLLYQRKDAAEFERVVSGIRAQSAQVIQENEAVALEAEQAHHREGLQEQIDAFATTLLSNTQSLVSQTHALASVPNEYQSAARQAGQLKAVVQRANANTDEGSYLLDDARYDLESNRDNAASVHRGAREDTQALETRYQTVSAQASQYLAECQEDTRLLCASFSRALQAYNTSVASYRTAAARENATYTLHSRSL